MKLTPYSKGRTRSGTLRKAVGDREHKKGSCFVNEWNLALSGSEGRHFPFLGDKR
jgi:hypothetical protein